MFNSAPRIFIKKSLLNSQILGTGLIVAYCAIYGITAQVVLSGVQLIFFLSSLMFALSIIHVRDPEKRKTKIKKGIFFNQIIGTALVFAYILIFGASSFAILGGFQLVFFMSSYIFAMSLFYIRDPERLRRFDGLSASITGSSFKERNPCFINSQDLSWLVRELNSSLTCLIGFTELMLNKQYSEAEKEYMLRNVYEQALTMSHCVDKVSQTIPDSQTKPKEVYEVADLLSDKNFK